jgi:surface antigen/type II secretory pathway pseudopilin PulG
MKVFRKKAARRRLLTFSVVGGNMVILGIVTGVILFGSQDSVAERPMAAVADVGNQAVANPLDHVSSANIAETVAQMSRLAETTAVTNQADSETTELAMMPTTSSVVDKPQVISSSGFASNKDITTYTTVAGDTITAIATKFGITSDSIRWSNNVSGDAIGAGVKLIIPPVTGIAYKVQAGDTAVTLAAKFRADQNKIIAYNDAELSGLKLGELILIPDGTKAAAVARSATTTSRWGGSASYGGYNGYDFGYCTYWVAKLRAQSGSPVPTNLGNASTWATRASAMGLPTGSEPRVGAAVVTSTRGAGHVAYVTAVNNDGTITISEMNHVGWNKVDTRDLPAASNFRYVY